MARRMAPLLLSEAEKKKKEEKEGNRGPYLSLRGMLRRSFSRFSTWNILCHASNFSLYFNSTGSKPVCHFYCFTSSSRANLLWMLLTFHTVNRPFGLIWRYLSVSAVYACRLCAIYSRGAFASTIYLFSVSKFKIRWISRTLFTSEIF